MYSAKEKRGTIYLKKKLINKKYNPAALTAYPNQFPSPRIMDITPIGVKWDQISTISKLTNKRQVKRDLKNAQDIQNWKQPAKVDKVIEPIEVTGKGELSAVHMSIWQQVREVSDNWSYDKRPKNHKSLEMYDYMQY